jgi:hypothetical protein
MRVLAHSPSHIALRHTSCASSIAPVAPPEPFPRVHHALTPGSHRRSTLRGGTALQSSSKFCSTETTCACLCPEAMVLSPCRKRRNSADTSARRRNLLACPIFHSQKSEANVSRVRPCDERVACDDLRRENACCCRGEERGGAGTGGKSVYRATEERNGTVECVAHPCRGRSMKLRVCARARERERVFMG